MNIAEYIDQQFTDRPLKLIINGGYTKPSEFSDMKAAFTKASARLTEFSYIPTRAITLQTIISQIWLAA